MKEYFFDTYAIIELIKGNPKYEFVKDFTIITGVMNLAEIYYALLLENKKEKADEVITCLNLQLLNISSDAAIKGALFRYKNKKANLSYIDSVGYILALDNNLIFLTGDKEFEDLESVEFVKK